MEKASNERIICYFFHAFLDPLISNTAAVIGARLMKNAELFLFIDFISTFNVGNSSA
jgi:hypothetical protein